MSQGKRFRRLVAKEPPLQIPGAINAYCALLARDAGFKALYLSGAGVANASFGLPDLGVTTLGDVLEDARRVTAATELPLLVDVDTGFGSAFNIARTVREMERAGVAAIHIEDQEQAKRCGHRPNKATVAVEEMCDRLKAAVDARRDDDFVIMARTDAFAREGRSAALERAAAYVAAGADMIFAEALHTLDDYAAFTRAIEVPVLANLTEFGLTPYFTLTELERAGVKLVLYPLSAFRAMSRAAQRVYEAIRGEGTQRSVLAAMQTREQLYDVLGYHAYERKLDALFAASAGKRAARANRRSAGASAESYRNAERGGASARRSLARHTCRRQRGVVDELERGVVAEAEQIERIFGRRRGLHGLGLASRRCCRFRGFGRARRGCSRAVRPRPATRPRTRVLPQSRDRARRRRTGFRPWSSRCRRSISRRRWRAWSAFGAIRRRRRNRL